MYIFDIDGVILDFVTPFIRRFNEKYGTNVEYEDISLYDIYLTLGMDKKETFAMGTAVIREDELTAYPGASETLKMLPREQIVLLTARHSEWDEYTRRALDRNGISYSKIIYTETYEKIDYCVGSELFVEDNLKTAANVSSVTKKTMLFDRPWNKSLDINPAYERVYNWEQIARYLTK